MKLKARDLIGTVLVIAIGVPYIWYLIEGEAPFVEDPRGMSAIGLILGLAAYIVMQRGDPDDLTDRVEISLYVVSLGLGVLALLLAETASAEVLLAVFMGSILVVWAIKMMDHAGVLPMAQHPTGSS